MKVHEKNHIPLVQIKELTWGYLDSKKVLFKKFNFELEKGGFYRYHRKVWDGEIYARKVPDRADQTLQKNALLQDGGHVRVFRCRNPEI